MFAIPRIGQRPRLIGTALAAVLPLAVMSAVVPPGASAAAGLPGGGWSGLWLSTSASGTAAVGTSLKDVRTIIGADTGTAATLTGAGVGVAVVDTGVAAVPGLPAAQVVNGPDLSFESQSKDLRYQDTYGHGTHMTGIIVANDTASGAKGIAPKAKVTSIKVGTANGAADVTQVIAAIDWVVANRNHDSANPIKVLNLSYGSGGNPVQWTDPLQLAVEQAWKAGILVVAAAGNQGAAATKLNNPANDQYVVAVGGQATKGTASVADDDMSAFTNYDKGRPLDLLAPGESIASLRVPGSNIDNGFASARVGETLFKGSGTSQAAAVTSAAAALLFQQKPAMTPDQVKGHMTTTRTWPTFKGNALKNGIGFLNVNAAVASVAANKFHSAQTFSQSSGTGKVELARGNSHVVSDNVTLSGEKSIFGPFDSAGWAAKSKAKTAWAGGVWMGYRMAGDGWTGTSFASKTWAAGTWPGKSWGGAASWSDPAWTGRYWSGRYWSAGTWTGRYWSSDDWSSSYWG